MKNLRRVQNKLLRIALPRIFRPRALERLIRLGSVYGGWTVPLGKIDADSICYSFGGGEDLTFDLELALACGCTVHVFDPTPRAQEHFDVLCCAAERQEVPGGSAFSIYQKKHLDAVDKVVFHSFGIWNDDTVVDFYQPVNSRHVSHSLTNIQRTKSGFRGQVKRLKTIKRELGHDKVHFLKADIEGAEFDIIYDMLSTEEMPNVLAVEFDAVSHGGLEEILTLLRTVRVLKNRKWLLSDIDDWNYLFIRNGMDNLE